MIYSPLRLLLTVILMLYAVLTFWFVNGLVMSDEKAVITGRQSMWEMCLVSWAVNSLIGLLIFLVLSLWS